MVFLVTKTWPSGRKYGHVIGETTVLMKVTNTKDESINWLTQGELLGHPILSIDDWHKDVKIETVCREGDEYIFLYNDDNNKEKVFKLQLKEYIECGNYEEKYSIVNTEDVEKGTVFLTLPRGQHDA